MADGNYHASNYNQWLYGIGQPRFQQGHHVYQPIYQVPPPYKEPSTHARPVTEFEHEPYVPKQTFFQRHFGGLKRTLRFFLVLAIVVLVVNISWLVHAQSSYGIQDGYGKIAHVRCDEAKRLNLWLHLLINVLSTLLLTGSGTFMATYCSPSRKEVDKAHARRKSLRIGLLSLGNLRWISKRKGFVVVILSMSSIPFHLLYNSLVFVSLSVNNYYWLATTESYLEGAPYNLTGPVSYAGGNSPYFSIPDLPDGEHGALAFLPYQMDKVTRLYEYFDQVQKNASTWEKLDNKGCIQAYSNAFVSERRNLILVSSQKNDTDSLLTLRNAVVDIESNWWICSLSGNDGGNMKCQPSDYLAAADSWSVFGFPIEYCMSEPVEDMCSVEFSMPIMITVVVCNAVKVFAMLWVLLRFGAEGILITVGDAAVSFLQKEDMTTRGMCLADRQNIAQCWNVPGFAVSYTGHRKHWGSAVSKKRWLLYFSLILVSFILIAGFAVWGFSHVKNRGIPLNFNSLWSLGLGTVHQDALTMADNQTSTIGMAILANIPQLFLAMVWLLFMGITTSMFLAQDWSRLAHKGQALMVSTPRGEQRGTWLLGAPLKYGIPLMVIQILLHWFISQSIFVVQMTAHNQDGSIYNMPYGSDKMINCGYSPIGVIFCVIASVLLVLSSIVLMLRRFPKGSPPMVSTCSAAISAACHPMARKEGMEYKNIMWAVVGAHDNRVGHCSLISESVFEDGYAKKPTAGWIYA